MGPRMNPWTVPTFNLLNIEFCPSTLTKNNLKTANCQQVRCCHPASLTIFTLPIEALHSRHQKQNSSPDLPSMHIFSPNALASTYCNIKGKAAEFVLCFLLKPCCDLLDKSM